MKPKATARALWFRFKSEFFAVPMENLQEVLTAGAVRPLPAMEPSLAGLVQIRDNVFPAFNPALFIDASPAASGESGFFVVVGVQRTPVLVILADEIGKVIDLPKASPLKRGVRIPEAFEGECTVQNRTFLVVSSAKLADAMQLTAPSH